MDKSAVDVCYENLANAIVIQAVNDYRSLLGGSPPTQDVNEEEIEKFFKSDWHRMLTKVDGHKLMTTIKKEFKQ